MFSRLSFKKSEHIIRTLIIQGVRLLFGLFTTITIGRAFPPTEIATWFLWINLFSMMQIYDYGFAQVLQRDISSKYKNSNQLNALDFNSAVVVSITSSVITIFSVAVYASINKEGNDIWVCISAACSTSLVSLSTSISLIALALHLVSLSQWLLAIQAVAIFGATILSAVFDRNIVSMFWFQSISSLLVFAFGVLSVRKHLCFNSSRIKQVLCNTLHIITREKASIIRLAIVMISFQIMTRLFHVSISRVFTAEEFAAYGLTVQMLSVAIALSGGLFSISLPAVTTSFAKGDLSWKKKFVDGMSLSIMILIIVLIFEISFVMSGLSSFVWPNIKFDYLMLVLMALYITIEFSIGQLSQLLVAIRVESHLYSNAISALLTVILLLFLKKYCSGIQLLTYRFLLYFTCCGIPILFFIVKNMSPKSKEI